VRSKTRRERYDEKKRHADTFPISIVCTNFEHDGNLAFIIRAAACFGAECIHVIGSVPSRSDLYAQSGSLFDYVQIKKHTSPSAFLNFAKNNEIRLISAEIFKGAKPITSYSFNFDSPLALVVGNEGLGVPTEILYNSEIVYIPMPGVGFCLNTSQTANIMLYEATKQYQTLQKHIERANIDWSEQGMYNLP